MSSKLKVGVVGCGIGQLLYYMGWVDANLSRTGKSRGIIVAKEISDDLRLACQRAPDVSLYRYNLSVTTSKVYPSADTKDCV